MGGEPLGTRGRWARLGYRWGLALSGALLFGLYAARPELAFLNYFAIVPWAVLYSDPARPREPLGIYFSAVWLTNILLYPQVRGFGWFVAPVMCAVWGASWVFFAPLLRRISASTALPRTLTVAVVWTATEWVRALLTIANADFYGLGYSQARFPLLVQIADVTGGYGISFLVAAVNGLIADAFFAVRDGGRRLSALRSRRLIACGVGVGAAFVAVLGYGWLRLPTVRSEPGPRVAIVQPNLSHKPSNAIGVHLGQVLMTDKAVPAGSADLIIWPENAILDYIRREGVYLEDLAWLAESKGAPLLVGAMDRSSRRPGRATNAAVLVNAKGEILGQYDKQVLFPWSERIPMDDLSARLWPAFHRTHRSLVRKGWGYLSSGIAGERMVLLDLPWDGRSLPFGALICVENAYPPVPAEARRLGARFFVNLTSEGLVGGVIQEQLLRIAILRSVENRISYVRAGNTGISGIIGPTGRVERILRGTRGAAIGEAGVLIDRVPISSSGVTVYAMSHDAFALACVIGTLVLLATSFRRGGGARATALLLLLALAVACDRVPSIGSDATRAPESLRRGSELFRGGNARAAIPDLAAACADAAACRDAIPLLSEAFEKVDRPEAAAALFGEIATRHPKLAAEALGERGLFRQMALDVTGAESDFKTSLEKHPTARTYGLLGNLQLRYGNAADAVDSFREAARMQPSDVQTQYLLGRALRYSGDLTEARRVLEEALARDNNLGSAWVVLGRVLLAQGDRDAARLSFERALLGDPQNIEARFWLARFAIRSGDRPTAERLLREIRQIEERPRGPR